MTVDPGARLNPMHYAVVRLETYFDDVSLETATGFFVAYERDGSAGHALLTNWHVLSGRNPRSPGMLRRAEAPNNVRFMLHHRTDDPNLVRLEGITLDLYDTSGRALWSEHPTLGRSIDVGAVDLRDQLLGGEFRVTTVGQIAHTYDMSIQLGSEAFVVGYPHGFSHFANTPVWKRASIASEPHLGEENSNHRVLIDATTRPGMSGSPVILRASTHYLSEDGEVRQAPGAMRWVGVYSSRPTFGSPDDPASPEVPAEIGYFVKTGPVAEILEAMKSASNWAVVPE